MTDQTSTTETEAPKAIVSLGAKKVTMFYPRVQIGEVVLDCEHQSWGHQKEKAAKACAAALTTKATALHAAK